MRFCKSEGVLKNTWQKRSLLNGIVMFCVLVMVLAGCENAEQGKKNRSDETVTDIPIGEALYKEGEAQKREKQQIESRSDTVQSAYQEPVRAETVQPQTDWSLKTGDAEQSQRDQKEEAWPETTRAESVKVEVNGEQENDNEGNPADSEKVKQPVTEIPKQEESAQSAKQLVTEEETADVVKVETHTCAWDTGTVKISPGCAETGLKTYKCSQCGAVKEEELQPAGHQMTTQWYGEAPDCTHGGYQAVLCSVCGWVDETACKSVPPLEHMPVAQEMQHGNCREDTIIVYTCSYCKEQTGYERYPEREEHSWVTKETQVWDEEIFDFVTVSVECCERCNAVL